MLEYRHLFPADIDVVCRLQASCYPAVVHESADSLQAKIMAAADSCFLASRNGAALAYVIALPWQSAHPIALDSPSCTVPESTDCMYIHDMAVCASARGNGVGRRLLSMVQAATDARSLSRQCLVAVHGAAAFWERHGFRRLEGNARIAAFLAPYGSEAVYMERLVPSAKGRVHSDML